VSNALEIIHGVTQLYVYHDGKTIIMSLTVYIFFIPESSHVGELTHDSLRYKVQLCHKLFCRCIIRYVI